VADEARAQAAGVSAFLHKPVSPELMQGMAEEAMRAQAPVGEAAEPAAEPVVAAPDAAPVAAKASTVGRRLLNVALFLAAPFIGLAYAVMMPVVGLGALVWLGTQALVTRARAK
jgi:hypothetical protein